MTSSRMRPAATLALVALIGAGCAHSANNDSGAVADADAGQQNAADRDRAVKFSECMRNNGVADFPDPNARGDFDYGVSVTPAVFTRAIEACKDLQPPGSLSAERSPEQQQAGLEFARCLRAHGVPDFPDPVEGQPLVDTNRIPSSDKPGGMTILNAAMHTCGAVMDRALAGP